MINLEREIYLGEHLRGQRSHQMWKGKLDLKFSTHTHTHAYKHTQAWTHKHAHTCTHIMERWLWGLNSLKIDITEKWGDFLVVCLIKWLVVSSDLTPKETGKISESKLSWLFQGIHNQELIRNIYSFINVHLFRKYLLSHNYVQGTVQGMWKEKKREITRERE